MSDPNHQVIWKPTRPDFAITCVRSTSHNCYHESWWEVVSRRPISAEGIEALSNMGLLGIGQGYAIERVETIVDSVPPVTIDRRTDEVVDVPPTGYNGALIVAPHQYAYQRTVVKRICDSGD